MDNCELIITGSKIWYVAYLCSTPDKQASYVFDFIFNDQFGIDYEFTQDKGRFWASVEPKLNYSEEQIGDELFFHSTPLLFEKGINAQDISVFEWDDSKAFFATHHKYIFPFDPFAASFFLLSRYEEYLPHQVDLYGRFDVKASLAWQKNFLQKPVIDLWVKKIKQALQQRFPQLTFKERKYQHISTVDIDNAYAFREKGFVRSAGALMRNVLQKNGKELAERISVLTGRKQDPYDTYDELFRIRKEYELKCIYFFLLGDYSENDKNISHRSKKLHSLIKFIADYNAIGIHPSFASASDRSLVAKEKGRLEKITRRIITNSRQHFLLLKFPDTYRNLLENDITDDYSMGYAGDVGFRAGTCSSFYFYDLEREIKTKLKIHPFAVMDATLLYYLKVKPEESLNIISSLVEEVKKVNGTFISLWHNESLSDIQPWKGWKHVYGEMVKLAV